MASTEISSANEVRSRGSQPRPKPPSAVLCAVVDRPATDAISKQLERMAAAIPDCHREHASRPKADVSAVGGIQLGENLSVL